RVRLPLVAPFRTSHGTQTHRDALIVRVCTDLGEGWGECGADSAPYYSAEYSDGAQHVIRAHLAPLLLARSHTDGEGVGPTLAAVQGHPMAKAALEMAVLDADLRARGESLAQHLGATRTEVACGVSVGIQNSIDALCETIAAHVADGYARVKLKIEP